MWPVFVVVVYVGGLWFVPSAAHARDDQDGDELIDAFEEVIGTRPDLKDTDGDGHADGVEVYSGFDPLSKSKKKLAVPLYKIDRDGDGLTDEVEIHLGTRTDHIDSDGDGYGDGEEVMFGYDPLSTIREKVAKRIEVSLADQRVSYFIGPHRLKTVKVSTGLPGWDTPKGEFKVIKKVPVVHYKGEGYDYPNTKWNLMFKYGKKGNYYLHGAYWHNAFGRRRSHGCVNVSYRDVEPIYGWADVGTVIIIK